MKWVKLTHAVHPGCRSPHLAPGGALALPKAAGRTRGRVFLSLRPCHSLYKQVTFKCLGYKLRPCRLPREECKHSTVVGANSETDFIIYSRPRGTGHKRTEKTKKKKKKKTRLNSKSDQKEKERGKKKAYITLHFGSSRKEM